MNNTRVFIFTHLTATIPYTADYCYVSCHCVSKFVKSNTFYSQTKSTKDNTTVAKPANISFGGIKNRVHCYNSHSL